VTEAEKPVLLCTNDDGVKSVGLALLARVADQFGDVWTVAPAGNRARRAMRSRCSARSV